MSRQAHHLSGKNSLTDCGSVQLTSFFSVDSTILSATYLGSSMGKRRGFTPLNIDVFM